MTEILRIAKTYEPMLDYWELVVQNASTIASHTATNRPSPEAIMANYQLDEQLLEGCRPWIVIFDDVLTAGSHFKAMKSLILQHIPEACILGLFVARTTRGAQII
ncbi:TPA: hypothetical protein RO208_003711 [Escherichia coli]|nr:hypothetical protein [Escherichia coli]HDX9814949.1 hypothetical protein [Escherichia coli]